MKDSWIAFVNERAAPPLYEQGFVEATSWRLVQSSTGSLHLSMHLGDGVARVTSATLVINSATRTVMTNSGRIYRLASPPEQDAALLGVIRANATRSGVLAKDVSEEIWAWCCATKVAT